MKYIPEIKRQLNLFLSFPSYLLRNGLIAMSTILVVLFVLSSCNPARRLPDNTYLLNKNRYKLLDKEDVSMYDIQYISRYVPNKRILDIYRFNLRMYVLFDTKKEHRFNNWVKKHIGEAPVILDTIEVNNTVDQIKLYLNNHGYFNSEVTKEIKIRRKKAKVTYKILANKPYTIKAITYDIEDDVILKLLKSDSAKSLIKVGDQYQSKMLTQERDRMADFLNNNGYYRFSKEFINFAIDTNLQSNGLNITTIIQDPFKQKEKNIDTNSFAKHTQYYIRDIIINTNFNPINPTEVFPDTLIDEEYNSPSGKIAYIYNQELNYSPRIMTKYLSFKSGDLYNLSKINRTYSRLNELKNFSYINISFFEVEDSTYQDDSIKYIDCKIQLKPTEKHSFSAELKGTNTGGNLGVGIDFTTTTRNVFRGGENLSYKIGAAYEAQTLFIDTKNNLLSFNTFELDGNIKLDVPRFFFPISEARLSSTSRPKTVFNLGGNYQQRPDYNRFISILNFGYEWNLKATKRIQVYLIDFNVVKINPTERFSRSLSQYNRIIREQYTDHFIAAFRLNYIYDNQATKKGRNFIYVRYGFESVGNTLNLIMDGIKAPKNSSQQYTIGGIPYANYMLNDIDFRYYHLFTKKTSFAFRSSFGIGIPFTNSYSLPFEKSFYLGGPNSMRGWKMRSLGPGTYNGEQSLESTGDIKIESNVEFRFPIWDYFRGAIFTDVGNIWLVRPNSTIPNGEFKISNFYKEFAVDFGIGLRLDFDFFLIRFDAAIPIVNPVYISNPELKKPISLDQGILNFGIGYPF